MRQINDMPSSMLSSVLVHGGLLLLVFGLASAFYNGQAGLLAVSLAGGVALGVGIATRKPSQKAAYRTYIASQERVDLVKARTDKWMDPESVEVIIEELSARKS